MLKIKLCPIFKNTNCNRHKIEVIRIDRLLFMELINSIKYQQGAAQKAQFHIQEESGEVVMEIVLQRYTVTLSSPHLMSKLILIELQKSEWINTQQLCHTQTTNLNNWAQIDNMRYLEKLYRLLKIVILLSKLLSRSKTLYFEKQTGQLYHQVSWLPTKDIWGCLNIKNKYVPKVEMNIPCRRVDRCT